MSIRQSLCALEVLLLSVGAGCVALPGATDAPETSGADLVTTSTLRVSGTRAERIIHAFESAGAVEQPTRGRAELDVTKLSVITSENGFLDENDPNVDVPSTSASFDDANASPAHRTITDPPAIAQVMFEALAAVDPSLCDSDMGKTFVSATKVECSGTGPGAGDDPNRPPPTRASCEVTSEQNKTFVVDGAKALRIVQAFRLASDSAVDRAMGGRFSVIAGNVSCERWKNIARDETDPLFEIPVHSCKGDAPYAEPFAIEDKDPIAVAILKAIEAAGIPPKSALGKTGTTSSHLTCTRGPGQETSCAIARP